MIFIIISTCAPEKVVLHKWHSRGTIMRSRDTIYTTTVLTKDT